MVEIEWKVWSVLWNGISSSTALDCHYCNSHQDLWRFMKLGNGFRVIGIALLAALWDIRRYDCRVEQIDSNIAFY